MEEERSTKTNTAIDIALKYFQKFNFEYHTQFFKTNNPDIQTVSVYINNIVDDNGVLIGNGKGRNHQSLASGLFESLEHYLSDPIYHKRETFDHKISKIVEFDNLLLEEYPIDYLFSDNKQQEIETIKYYSIIDNKVIYYPAFLTNPSFAKFINHPNLIKYSTANGTAIGLNKEEALIHAINEVVERDALSVHYIKSFLSKEHYAISVIDKKTLPNNLLGILQLVENEIGTEVTVLDISTEFNITTYLVYARHKDYIIPFQGSGSSIFPSYAMERALLECLQSFHLYDKDLELEDRFTLTEVENYKKFKSIVLLDYKSKKEIIPFTNKKRNFPNLNSILKDMVENIQKRGRDIYFTPIYDDEDLYCTHVIIPGLERFHLIKSGLLVLPYKRGQRLI